MLDKNERNIINQTQRPQEEGKLQTEGAEREHSRTSSPLAQMDRLFDEVFKRPFFSFWSPRMGSNEMEQQLYVPVDIFEDGESVVVKAEIPGIRKEDINVELTPDSITISGQKRSEQRVEEKDYHRLETSFGSFTKTCHLPAEILTDRARAVFRDGVLEVRIPKTEQAARRGTRINID
jgi:HSP20 family protein